jgi:hypothetical protein
MKKFLIFILIFYLLIYFASQFLKQDEPIDKIYNQISEIQDENIPVEENKNTILIDIIEKINTKNSKIKNLYTENVSVSIEQKGCIPLKVNGIMAIEKEKNFRLIIWHKLMGKEIDIGSNKQLFWFWSKRMKNPGLYFAKHKNLNKTMLKTPLNPNWLMECLNIQNIDYQNSEIKLKHNLIAVIQKRISTLNENVTVETLIDPQKEIILGHYLYDSKDILIASAQITENQIVNGTILPKKIFISWPNEGIKMEWKLNDLIVNTNISNNYWCMPKNKANIEMGI